MKKAKMPSMEALKALYSPMDERYADAIQATLQTLKDERKVQPVMKKKLSLGLVLTIILVLLACAALAVSSNVFGLFAQEWGADNASTGQLYAKLDQASVPGQGTQSIAAATDMPFPEAKFTLSQSYYDGHALYLAYALEGAQTVYDYTWTPTAEELTRMEKIDVYGVTKSDAGMMFDDKAYVETMVENAKKNGAAGSVNYQSYLSDGVYLTGTDTYLDLEMSDQRTIEDGTTIGVKQFASPLPDQAQDKDALSLSFFLYRSPTYNYFDGENWYILFGERTQTPMTVTVERNTYENISNYPLDAEFADYSVNGTVTLSALTVRLNITLTSKTDKPVMSEDFVPGELVDYNFYADGVQYGALSGQCSGLGQMECNVDLVFPMPDQTVDTLTFVPVYYPKADESDENGGIEHTEETLKLVLAAAAPTITALPH